MSRTLARETAVRLLYQMTFQDDFDWHDTVSNTMDVNGLTEADNDYIDDVLSNLPQYLSIIDQKITTVSHRWRIDRMSKMDRSIMRLSVYEIFYRDDIPASVSINEAVELAKRYGSDESPAFINGLLSSVLSDADEKQE